MKNKKTIILVSALVVILIAAAVALGFVFSKQHKHKKHKKPHTTAVEEVEGNTSFDGIDVSHYQGTIDWKQVAQYENIQFVYIKATQGTKFTDRQYSYNIRQARQNGLKVGSYHFFSHQTPARKQFEHFQEVAKKAEQDLIPMVDVEVALSSLERQRMSLSAFQDSLQLFMDLCKNYYGEYPMIYATNRSYNELCGERFLNYHLYIGRYGSNEPVICHTSKKHTIWQYSEKGNLKGIPQPVDLSRFANGSTVKDILLK